MSPWPSRPHIGWGLDPEDAVGLNRLCNLQVSSSFAPVVGGGRSFPPDFAFSPAGAVISLGLTRCRLLLGDPRLKPRDPPAHLRIAQGEERRSSVAPGLAIQVGDLSSGRRRVLAKEPFGQRSGTDQKIVMRHGYAPSLFAVVSAISENPRAIYARGPVWPSGSRCLFQ